MARPDLATQLKLIREAGQVHAKWYEATYPDVPLSGLSAAEHYLRYGAMLGRRPRSGFDTRYYVDTHPEVRKSGLNPLVHYVLHGKAAGLSTRAPAEERVDDGLARVRFLRQNLLSLGIGHKSEIDLRAEVASGATPAVRCAAAHELAMWLMRSRTRKGWQGALEALDIARQNDPDRSRQSRLITLELLCHLHLDQIEAAQAVYDRAGPAGLVTPDVLLAWSNFAPDLAARLDVVNVVLRLRGIPELSFLPDAGLQPYDRLTVASAPPPVIDGPKVTVLIAAHAAEGVIGTALRALQEQSWKNLEIIVLDDCSPDGTCGVVERAAASDPRIRLVRMPRNGGAYVARNEGLDLATGDFVTLHDADDWAHPLRIETQVRYLQDNPEVLGCTTQQARATADLGFTRWTGSGQFIIPNTSSFLFRRAPMREHFGYWDTVRFSADSELIRRFRRKFGKDAIVNLESGPLAFQRDSDSSIIADDALGINGFLFGARKEYYDAQTFFHRRAKPDSGALRYGKDPAPRPFPAPAIMHPDRDAASSPRHFPVIIASEFRMPGGSIESCIQEIHATRAAGHRVGLIEMYRYDLPDRIRSDMLPEIRALIDGDGVQLLTYGEEVSCDLLLVRYPPVLQHRQRYLPRVTAGQIKVIVNQPPMSDYGAAGVRRYTFEQSTRNLRHAFGRDAVWHPIGPQVRQILQTRHAKALSHVTLSPEDWANIIHLPDWQRGPRTRGPADRLRIGRHSRDTAMKWPAMAGEVLAAYPDAGDVEVHVLGGASAPAALIGHVPENWVVHPYDALPVRDFLSGLDVYVYFTHPDWVESFGRCILEAMAVGVPVILPEIYRPLFADAAVYATLETALPTARRLHADPAAYEAQVQKAWAYLERHYSYAMHARRLQAAIVCQSGVRKPGGA